MTDLQKRLFAAFTSEYQSILESLRAFVLRIEAGSEKVEGEPLNEAFRMAHTLKGSAHVVGFSTIVLLAHRLESLFAKVRDKKVELGAPELRLILSVLDMVEDTVAASKDGKALPDVQPLVAALENLLGLAPAAAAAAAPAVAVVPAAVPVVPPAFVAATSIAAVTAPAPVPVPVPEKPVLVAVAPVPVQTQSAVQAPSDAETVRLSASHLDQLLGTAGELLSVIRGSRQVDTQIASVGGHLDAITREWELLRRSSASLLQKMNQNPEFARVAQFLDFVGTELMPLTKQIQSAREASKQSEWDLRNLSEQLQEDVRKARIVPAETVLGGFNKMVRDLASELGKSVDFRFLGLDVEADRVVLQALKDPLMHMLRNSIGHGIESKEARVSLGKDPIGKIFVRIVAAGGRMTITIEDDGQGLNESKIRNRAVAMNLISQNDVRSAEELAECIFQPGFSTASEISDISGRGMGMSVVAETIKRLQGNIKVRSEEGKRLTFVISVPIALANHRLILANYLDQPYAIPSGNVESLRRVKKSSLLTVDGKVSIMVNEVPTPVMTLGAALGMSDAGVNLSDEIVAVVVVHSGGRYLALAVDSISDECEAIIKNLGTPFRNQKVFSGAVMQGDGNLALVLDPHYLIEQGQTSVRTGHYTLKENTTSTNVKAKRLRVLVVDDSITTRTLEKGILESNGYHVSLAVDGMDALSKLQVEKFDLVISDCEMPRMDGFTLVSEIKKHPKFSKIPVIMVTSLEKDEDREKGLRLGANAYVLKQKFDQGDLLQTIKQVV